MTRRIRDITGTVVPEEVAPHLRELADRLDRLAERATNHVPSSNLSVALSNISHYTAEQLRQAASAFPSNIAALAWATRNLFEINLILRHIISSSAALEQWLGQLFMDEKDMLEGVRDLSDVGADDPRREAVESRLSYLRHLSVKHQVRFAPPFVMRTLAKSMDLEKEYSGLYRLFSKHVHPSSWLVNNLLRGEVTTDWMNIFIVNAQLYAGDTFQRVTDALDHNGQPPIGIGTPIAERPSHTISRRKKL